MGNSLTKVPRAAVPRSVIWLLQQHGFLRHESDMKPDYTFILCWALFVGPPGSLCLLAVNPDTEHGAACPGVNTASINVHLECEPLGVRPLLGEPANPYLSAAQQAVRPEHETSPCCPNRPRPSMAIWISRTCDHNK